MTRILITIFDALRPEFVTPELMPNLHAFAKTGVRYTNAHAVFPTETRVNQTALITGCQPRTTGIVANHFLAPDIFPDRIMNTGKDDELEPAMAKAGSNFIGAPTLGERLAKAGYSFASLSAGTAGGGRLINHTAERDGSYRISMRAASATVPPGLFEHIAHDIGTIPEFERPAKAWISWAINTYLEWIEPNVSPDVMLLWLCEPDETFHYEGIGSEASIDTLRHADDRFGRILQHHDAALASGDMQIIAQSDHGQITLEGDPIDLCARLKSAGFRAARQPGNDVDCAVAVHNAGGIWVSGEDEDFTGEIVEFLTTQDWCGPLFTRHGTGGTLKLADISIDHARAPTIALALQAGDDENSHGVVGTSVHDAPYPPGGGCHGGLSRHELHNFLSLGGTAFQSGATIAIPAGNIDIAPTVCHLLGIADEKEFDGRVLHEALPGAETQVAATDTTLSSKNETGKRTHLAYSELDGARYLTRAWVT